ncbi:MAG: tyrosine--tRNA ligase [Pirellulaceae bacterium]
MTTPNPLYDDLQWRGLIYQSTDEQIPHILNTPRTVYVGFDPTADSLHIGSLLGLQVLRRFQQAGHRPVALVGGATGMIGDPSGKSDERQLLSVDRLRENVVGIERQMRQFLDFDEGPCQAVLVNNFDWMRRFSFLDFLRDIGKNFPVNVMMSKESVKNRISRDGGGISYTEFSYMLLQAYDFVHLQQEFDCSMQLGGSDQWGNITAGIDLARRLHGVQLYGLTWPLLLKSDGTKHGKTEGGSVWLSAERTSPYKFYQYWINVDDSDTANCLKFLTELDREEIQDLEKQVAESPERNIGQRRLAEELTRIVHGDAGVKLAQKATAIMFGGEIGDLSDATLLDIFSQLPSHQIDAQKLNDGLSLVEAFVLAGIAKSKGEARRAVEQGGAYVNNRRVQDVNYELTQNDLASESVVVLRRGKKSYGLLRIS